MKPTYAELEAALTRQASALQAYLLWIQTADKKTGGEIAVELYLANHAAALSERL